ncbi:MAG TPA: Rrf2 family transcriptional regulator [Bacteroidales bacterium]|nr:Rrf2 family transcriptional regulator [Bacteroidales bacterium]
MFNKETEYAIRALVYIKVQNLKNRKPGAAEISKEIDAPHFFIAKILQRLVRSGFMRSIKGKGGGFYFDDSKPEISLMDLMQFTEGGSSFLSCGFGLKECNEKSPCPLHDKYAPIRDSVNRLLKEETISKLARKVV